MIHKVTMRHARSRTTSIDDMSGDQQTRIEQRLAGF